jgi:hypothetical protein
MKNRDGRRTYQSLCGGSVTAASVQREIHSPNNVTKRSGGGGIVDEGVRHRRASAPAWSKPTMVQVLCSLGPVAERKRQRSGGRRR